MTLSERVTKVRNSLRMSQNQFAISIGVPQTTYNRFEKGNADLMGESLAAIVERYKVHPNYLFFGEEPMFLGNEPESVPRTAYEDLQRKYMQAQEELLEYHRKEKR